jgi:hypothetical protein
MTPTGPTRTASAPIGPGDGQTLAGIELWTPRGIGWASVLLGFPGALVLAALNWRRMGRRDKALAHLAAAVAGTWALFFVNAPIGVAVGVGVGYYLYRTQRRDQAPLAAVGRVTERNGLLGAVLAITSTLALVVSGGLVAQAVGIGGVANRGHVAFGTGAPSGSCIPGGQKAVFDPSEPIYLAAVMRETVQPGARVLHLISGPGLEGGTTPVAVEPPYDCLMSTRSIGPLPPGTYVVRYRYADRPELPDLAAGSFTIADGPGGSAAPVGSQVERASDEASSTAWRAAMRRSD